MRRHTESVLLSRLEEKNCNLTQVKIDEVLCLMCYVAAKVSANNAVPSWVVFLVKFLPAALYLLDVRRNVLLDVVLLQCLRSALHSVLLHLLRHVRVLDHGLSVTHGCLQRARSTALRSHPAAPSCSRSPARCPTSVPCSALRAAPTHRLRSPAPHPPPPSAEWPPACGAVMARPQQLTTRSSRIARPDPAPITS
uniref:Dynein light chain n=1 Tax=Coturnix japonica TaxID=93934 RepID=A0A8C2TNM8_COTJA